MADYRYLKAFERAARKQSFKAAAQDLRISVSALSRQISLLEASVGEQLFVRGNRKVALTAAGRKLAEAVRDFEARLTAPSETPLRIGCLESVFVYFLAEIIRRNPTAFEGALEIFIGSSRELHARLESGELDIAITHLRPAQDSLLSAFKLFEESVEWVGPKSGRTIVFSAFEDFYAGAERRRGGRIRVNSFHAAAELARLGVGRSLVAKPDRGGQSRRWIYALLPQLEKLPKRQARVLALLRNHGKG